MNSLKISIDEINEAVEILKQNKNIEYVAPELTRSWRGLLNPTDEYFEDQWSLWLNFPKIPKVKFSREK